MIMEVYLDGEKMEYKNETLEIIEKKLRESERVIHKITVNDVEMVNASLEEVFSEDAEKKIVVIESCMATKMINEAISEARQYIPRLKSGIAVLRDKTLGGEAAEAAHMLGTILEGLEWTIVTLQAYGSYMEDKEKKTDLEEELKQVIAVFGDLEEALRAEDMILICDILEYEIAPFLAKAMPMLD